MLFTELSRKDPPSPPRPPRPPPPSPTGKKHKDEGRIISVSRQDPPSPPRAPPPSPSKIKMGPNLDLHSPSDGTEIFPRLVELTISLSDVLKAPVDVFPRQRYSYCEDDMSIPGSPPPLEFTPPRGKNRKGVKRPAEELDDDDIFGPCLADTAELKKRKTIINLEDAFLFLPPALSLAPGADFFADIFEDELGDAGGLQEYFHSISACA
ncbi:hypothetical protein ABW19_dt0203099 [Dactylella cylindrospora]|nr:hypothetical protein ABW19_dt0203099 [Dactylella cylindrospora]